MTTFLEIAVLTIVALGVALFIIAVIRLEKKP
jgi:hypothetical protein